MRRFASLLSLCALFAAQTPFTPCPAGVVMDVAAAGAAPVSAAGARPHHHEPAVAAAQLAAAPREAGVADLTVPAPPAHDGTCTMLTRCQWVAVPTQPAGSEPVRGVAFGSAAGSGRAPANAEPLSSEPPPRSVS
jgi:hypothetical protein